MTTEMHSRHEWVSMNRGSSDGIVRAAVQQGGCEKVLRLLSRDTRLAVDSMILTVRIDRSGKISRNGSSSSSGSGIIKVRIVCDHLLEPKPSLAAVFDAVGMKRFPQLRELSYNRKLTIEDMRFLVASAARDRIDTLTLNVQSFIAGIVVVPQMTEGRTEAQTQTQTQTLSGNHVLRLCVRKPLNPHSSALDISRCKLVTVDGCTRLEELDIGYSVYNGMGKVGVVQSIRALTDLRRLSITHVHTMHLHKEVLVALMEALGGLTRLEELDLSHTSVGVHVAAVEALARALPALAATLRVLKYDGNWVRRTDVARLTGGIAGCTELRLNLCPPEDRGVGCRGGSMEGGS